MSGQDHFTLPTELLGQIAEPSLDFLPELIPLLLNTARPTEGKLHLAVAPDQRSADRPAQVNGYQLKTVKTGIVPIIFGLPPVGRWFLAIGLLHKGMHRERALMLTLAQMYVQAVSTR